MPLFGALAAAIPATGVVALANALSGLGWPANLHVLFGQVLVLLAAISLPVYTWQDSQERRARADDPASQDVATTAQSPPGATATPPAGDGLSGLQLFSTRLPAPLAGSLLCLELQDQGLRVHRSWWVAQVALVAAEREGQNITLRLSDGRHVPVGRTYRAALRSAGWI